MLAKLREFLRACFQVLKNVTFMDAWVIGYKTERDLGLAKKRIGEYRELCTLYKKEITDLKVRNILLEGIVKCLVAREERYYTYIPQDDMRGIHHRFPELKLEERDDKTRVRLKEDKNWRKEHAAKRRDDDREADGTGPSDADIVGGGFPEQRGGPDVRR